MTVSNWIQIAFTVVCYIIALIAAIYAKSGSKINKASKAGQVQDVLGRYAKWAVHLAEDAGLDTDDAKHEYAKQLIMQALKWEGVTTTPGMIDGAIKTAVSAMHLAYDDVGVSDGEIKQDVPDSDIVKPEDVSDNG